MFGSNYNTCIVSLGTESIGGMNWRTDSKVAPNDYHLFFSQKNEGIFYS